MELFSIRIQRTFQLVSTDMEEHSGKKSGRRAIIWLYNNKVVFLQKIISWL